MDIAAWLRELGLERYIQAFEANDIDAAVLRTLSADDLKELGVTSLGHRKKLLEAIAAFSPPSSAVSVVEAPAPASPAPIARQEAERRQLTVMFLDLVGSTELAAQLDPEDLSVVIRAYQEACASVIDRFEGHVARLMGDSVLAYFGWPRAHEDDAERAVRAGLAAVEEVGRLSVGAGAGLTARAGIATGQVVVGELMSENAARKGAVTGETPNLGARLQALAEPGTVVISQATRKLIGDLFDLDELGPQRLKGFAEPLVSWRVSAESRVEGRFEALRGRQLTSLIGRKHELGFLLERWAWAEQGDGQVVLVSGEPGIGKSRLVRALRERLAGESYVPLSHFCSPHHTNSAFYPVITRVEQVAGFEREDAPEVRLGKLAPLIAPSSANPDQAIALLATLLAIPTENPPLQLTPQRQKRLTLEALLEQLESLAAKQPVLLVYEDIQWIDPSTRELLDLVVERARSLPLLVLLTFRPEFVPPWVGQAHVATLALNRLGRPHAAALVDRLTNPKRLPTEVRDHILAKTDGVPLFLEELTKAILESGLLLDVGDRYDLSGPVPAVAIPATLQDSLMARLDRSAPFKEVAQIGAVIGREFSYKLIAAVSPLSEYQLNAMLDRLVDAGLIFRRGAPPDAIYSFKHILVQETAYNALLRSRREQLHRQIARALVSNFPDVLATNPELIAHHCTEAGDDERAIEYWRMAGDLAIGRGAFHEAVAQLSSALRILAKFPEGRPRDRTELALHARLGNALLAAKGFAASETGAAYARVWRLSDRLGDRTQLLLALFGRWAFHISRAEVQDALAVADEMARLARDQGDVASSLIAGRALANTWFFLGDLGAARRYAEAVIAAYDPAEHAGLGRLYSADVYVMCAFFLAHSLLHLGYPEQARPWRQAGLARAREVTDVVTLAHALHHTCLFDHTAREPLVLRAAAEELIACATEHSLPFWLALGRIFHGAALAGLGQSAEGMAELRAGIGAYRATEGRLYLPFALALWADLCYLVGEVDQGLRAIAEAKDFGAQTGVRGFEVYLHRLEGLLLLAQPDPDPEMAEACLQRAIDLADKQGARLAQLRAAVTLAGLWRNQGKRAEARELVRSVYGWFSEGFDTPDLHETKTLLDELS